MACFWSRVYQCNSRLNLSFRMHADAPDMSSSASQKRRLIARFRLAANATTEASLRGQPRPHGAVPPAIRLAGLACTHRLEFSRIVLWTRYKLV